VAFVRDWCEAGPEKRINAKELYAAYCLWSKEAGHSKPLNNIYFGRALTSAVTALKSTQPSASKRRWLGITLTDDGWDAYSEAVSADIEKRSR
jgi:phage/plasmid-associated DNA primase